MAESNNNKHLAFANAAMSSLLQMKGLTKQSKEKYKIALNYLEKVQNSPAKTHVKADIYNYAGLAEFNRGNFSAALEKWQQGIKFSEQIKDINQIVKFKANITLINEAVGNSQLAIKNLKELDHFITKNEDLFPKADVLNRRSNINLGLGSAYEGYFVENKHRMDLLDSAGYFYKKAIYYSKTFPYNKGTATLSLGNIFNWKGDYYNTEKTYLEVVSMSKKNKQLDLLSNAYYNLGDVYHTTGKNEKALLFYKKSDSISLLTNSNDNTYLKSNCYQARIYVELNKPELAHKHCKIYLDKLDEFESKLRVETAAVNYKQGIDGLTSEMLAIEKKYEKDLFWDKALKILYSLLVLVFVFLLVKNSIDKKKARKKMHALIQEFKFNIENKKHSHPKSVPVSPQLISARKEIISLNIDQAKEEEIVIKLLELEDKLEYLSADFTLSNVAKKIKTNTTYLSHVVNKRFEKTFGEYANELKINYVINEMITNDNYRKFSTQAAAESVGFKNAASFAKSFRKRTGVSPAQFANNI
ncbi:AraC family transcriptional regulator [Flavobacterium sp. KJJ]|uniref:AraC family transcriptional regulator n=1 Tax=Flavobacterium sp. KJJ TaxID=1270193 RepID=UPI001E36B84C|nr:AraC family transcriptional regulator [Flavobacterium sp. KJJ]